MFLWVINVLLHKSSPSALFTFNTVRPRQHGHHFADDILKCVFLNENVWISIKISLKFVPEDLINNIPALVQIMAWRRPGDKPLSEATMVRLPAHICVIRPQWDNICNWSRRSAASLQSSLPNFPKTTHVRIAIGIAVNLSAKLTQSNSLPADLLTNHLLRVTAVVTMRNLCAALSD